MVQQVRTVFSGFPGTPYYSNLYFADGDDPEICVGVVSTFWDSFAPHFADQLHYVVEGAVETLNTATGAVTGITVAAADQTGHGSGSTAATPGQVQGLIQWRTGVYSSGRELRGRMYIPAVLQVDCDGPVPTAGYVAALQGVGNDMLDGGAGDAHLQVWSRTHGQAAPVASAVASTMFATQRSRGLRG